MHKLSVVAVVIGTAALVAPWYLSPDSTVPESADRPIAVQASSLQAGHSHAALDRSSARAVLPANVLGPVDLLDYGDQFPVFCFAPGTDPAVVEYYERLMRGNEDPDFFVGGRWPGWYGSPYDLTWSLLPDGVYTERGESVLFRTLDAQFGNRETWIALMEKCFQRWDELSGVNYTRIKYNGQDWDDGEFWGAYGEPGKRGDIRIAMGYIDGQSNVLAYTYLPRGQSGLDGDMMMDSSEFWANSQFNYRFMRNVVTHELGHSIGLLHICPASGLWLMEPFITLGFDQLQHDDIRGAQWLYGDILENNDSAAEAANLGSLAPGESREIGVVPPPSINQGSTVCLDADSDDDWHKFTVTAPSRITVLLVPFGLYYDNSPQINGQCTSGNWVDSKKDADLAMQVIGQNGQRVIATADSQPAGESEVLVNVVLDEGVGTYYLRVYETGNQYYPQLYGLNLSISAQTGKKGDTNCDGSINFGDINPFVTALSDPNEYKRLYPNCNINNCDINGDGSINFGDINPLVECIQKGSCP